jgi:NADH dehydrogenase
MLQRDNVAADGAEGLDAFDITPTPLAAVAPGWLVQYRQGGRFGGVKTVEP